jgi:archaemetzincin
MEVENIILISFGNFDQAMLDIVAVDVSNVFRAPAKIRDGNLDLSEFYDPARRQYNGTTLLKKVDLAFGSDQKKTIALFKVDLFIPILTYIFGQAYLKGRSGIVSVYRLSNEKYGLKADEKILTDRLRKEVIHELGHMFGLVHCTDSVCVMRSSTYVEDIDQKSHNLCRSCRGKFLAGAGNVTD